MESNILRWGCYVTISTEVYSPHLQNRGYYMPARGYEFYLRVFNSRYRVEHEKIKFVSTRGHVIFCLLSKQQHQGYFSNFPKISEDFPKISDHFCKFSEQCPKFIRTFLIIFRKLPKMSEGYRRLPNISEQSSKMFRSQRNEFRFVW